MAGVGYHDHTAYEIFITLSLLLGAASLWLGLGQMRNANRRMKALEERIEGHHPEETEEYKRGYEAALKEHLLLDEYELQALKEDAR